MWGDWIDRIRGHAEIASQGRILPRPYTYIQDEMIVLERRR